MRRYPPGFLSLSARSLGRAVWFLSARQFALCSTFNERLGFTTAQTTDVLDVLHRCYLSISAACWCVYRRSARHRACGLSRVRVVVATGYALLAAESRPTLYVYVGLTLVAFGAGARRSWPQSLATRLFAAKPELHDRGLTLIYLLANVSALGKSGHR